MSQDDLISVLIRYPRGVTRQDWKRELNLKWICTDQITSLLNKKIISINDINKRGVKRYKLIGAPEEKYII